MEINKNDRDRGTLITGNRLRVYSFQAVGSRQIWMPTNEITAIAARTHVSRELRARVHCRHLGVYKESRVAH